MGNTEKLYNMTHFVSHSGYALPVVRWKKIESFVLEREHNVNVLISNFCFKDFLGFALVCLSCSGSVLNLMGRLNGIVLESEP